MSLTRASVSLIFPEPYVNGGGEGRVYTGILEAGSNEIDLAKDGGYSSSESLLLFISGVLQSDYGFNPDYSKIILPEVLDEDAEYQVIIGTILGHINQNYLNVIENSEATATALRTMKVQLANEMSTFKASVQDELENVSTVTYLVGTPSISLDRIAKGFNKTFTASANSLANPELEITRFALSIPELNIVEKAYYAVNNSANITINVPSYADYENLNIAIYAIDIENNRSKTYTKVVPIVDGTVDQPSILHPIEGEYLAYGQGITVQSSDFSCTADDTHSSSSWKITDDKEGKHILACEMSSPNKTSYLFPSYDLDKLSGNKTYYAHVLHTGALTGNSPWSLPRKFYTRNGVSTQNGRFIYRHESDRGIVIEWELNGEPKKLFVYDEIVKNMPMLKNTTNVRYNDVECEYSIRNTDQAPGGYSSQQNVITIGRNIYKVNVENAIPGTSNVASTVNNGSDDKFLNSTSNNIQVKAITSSRTLCNFWNTLNASNETPLLNYARSITDIDGIDNLDVPSIRELQVILSEFNNNEPILSKDKSSSFFASKIANGYLTCNTCFIRLGRYSGAYGNLSDSICYGIDAIANDGSCFRMFNTNAVYNVGTNSQLSLYNQDPYVCSYTDTKYASFLVRDITNF